MILQCISVCEEIHKVLDSSIVQYLKFIPSIAYELSVAFKRIFLKESTSFLKGTLSMNVELKLNI